MGKKNQSNGGNTLIKPRTKSIGEFLCDSHQIVIPPNQRPYAWEDEQQLDFFNDLENTRESNTRGIEYWHYFNMVTYVRNPENMKQIFIHDGQQRVTTSFITLFYLTYKIERKKISINLENHEKDLQNVENYKKEVINKWNTNRKLQMFSYNDKLLTEMVALFESPNLIVELKEKLKEKDIYTKSNIRIIKLMERMDIMDDGQDSNWMIQTFNALYLNFEIVLGELGNAHQAFKIFELVNNRGKKLSDVDLIKNYFYQIADDTDKKTDLVELETKFGKIIEVIGDDFEDVITKHWLLYFNTNEKSNYGKPTEIFFSVKSKFEEKGKGTLTKPQKRDLMFSFIDDIHDNLDYIKNIYYISSLDYESMMKDKLCEKKLNDLNFDFETVKKLVVQRTFVNAEFDYLDYYLYYVLLEFQRGGCNISFKYFDEYQSAVNFYVYRSYVNTGKMNVDRLNYCLGFRLNRDCDFKDKGLTNMFVQFLLESSDGHENYSQNFKNKLAAPEQEVSNPKAKILYQLLYGFDNVSMYYEYKGGKYSIIETEHVLPRSSKKKDFDMYDKFNLQSKDSKYKNKIEWLGNKLLLTKYKNIEVSTNFELKLLEYSMNSELFLNKEYFKILARTFKRNDNIPSDEILINRNNEYRKEIVAALEDQSVEENEQIMVEVEDKWRKYIANYFVENDILKLKSWENIDEIKEK